MLMKAGKREEAGPLRAQVNMMAERLKLLEAERKELEEQEGELLLSFPNRLDERVPKGGDEEDNQILETWGEARKFDFEPKDHHDLATQMGGFDPERATKIAGTRFAILKGGVARLERALINLFLDQAAENGYLELIVPYIVNRSAMTGTGQLPKFEEDLFKLTTSIGGEDGYLIPTAEVPVTNIHREEILNEEQLPIYYTAFTPCFRAEAGSYGRDTRGLIRQHQFHKVELVKITTPENSKDEHEALTRNARDLLEKLGLPYRLVRLCSGDISFAAQHCYDLEVWLPGQNKYREISSCSNFGDFQARRMRLRYRPKGSKKTAFCHTMNGSGLAIGRTVVAILENYQEADGSITIPDVLQPYLRATKIAADGSLI
jgi:seryl-tRNA synthetase